MPDTSLTIETRMVGNAGQKVNSLRDSFGGLFDYVDRARGNISGFVDSIFSLQSAVVGFATYGAGKSAWDLMIGSNAELESQKTTFRTIIGDVERANTLIRDIEEFSARTPFQQSDLIEGSRRLLTLTEDNVDRNKELVKVAAQLSAVSGPEQGVVQAAEALRDASAGEFERLKEFGIKLSKDEIDQTRKSGETLGQAAMRGVRREMEGMTGGRDVVGALSQTFEGKSSTLKDRFSKLMREMGEPAFDELKSGMDDALEEFERLQQDPKFQRETEEFAKWLGDAAESVAEFAPTLIREVPDAMQSVQDTFETVTGFYDRHSGLIKTVATAWAGNKLLGGAPMDLARFGVGKALQGTGAGGLLGEAAEGLAGKCCCEGPAGNLPDAGDTGDTATDVGGTLTDLAGGGYLGSLFGSSSGVLSGAAGSAVAAGAGVLGGVAGGVGLSNLMSLKVDPTETKSNAFSSGSQVTNAVRNQLAKGNTAAAKKMIIDAAGGAPDETFKGTEVQRSLMESVESRLQTFGLSAKLKEGQKFREMKFQKASGAENFLTSMLTVNDTSMGAISDMSGQQAVEKLNETNVDKIEVKVPPGTKNPEQFGRRAGKAAKKELDREARKRKSRE